MTQAVFRLRHGSHGRFFRLLGCLARPKLLRIVNLRGRLALLPAPDVSFVSMLLRPGAQSLWVGDEDRGADRTRERG